MNDSSTCPRSPARHGLEWLLVAAGVVVLVLAPMRRILVQAFLELAGGQFAQFQHHLQSLGPWGPVLSIALIGAGALALPVPVTIVMVADGLVFGTQLGTLISFVGGVLGALSAYTLGRSFGPAVLERFLPSSARVSGRSTAPFVTWSVTLWHWIPGLPFNPMSFAAGYMRMSVLTFLFFTTVGLLPACAVTAYLGVRTASDVPAQYWVPGLLSIGALWFAWRALRRRRPPSDTAFA
jgi:uncharacterized membrane protein YdjX (TVP38/TMEM64 family)